MQVKSLASAMFFVATISMSVNSYACGFKKQGVFKCYSSQNKQTVTQMLAVYFAKVNDFQDGIQVDIQKVGESQANSRIYTVGKITNKLSVGREEFLIDDAEDRGHYLAETYQVEVKCSSNKIKINRRYFYAEPGFSDTEGTIAEQVELVPGSHVEYSYAMTNDQALPLASNRFLSRGKYFCYWK